MQPSQEPKAGHNNNDYGGLRPLMRRRDQILWPLVTLIVISAFWLALFLISSRPCASGKAFLC